MDNKDNKNAICEITDNTCENISYTYNICSINFYISLCIKYLWDNKEIK